MPKTRTIRVSSDLGNFLEARKRHIEMQRRKNMRMSDFMQMVYNEWKNGYGVYDGYGRPPGRERNRKTN